MCWTLSTIITSAEKVTNKDNYCSIWKYFLRYFQLIYLNSRTFKDFRAIFTFMLHYHKNKNKAIGEAFARFVVVRKAKSYKLLMKLQTALFCLTVISVKMSSFGVFNFNRKLTNFDENDGAAFRKGKLEIIRSNIRKVANRYFCFAKKHSSGLRIIDLEAVWQFLKGRRKLE